MPAPPPALTIPLIDISDSDTPAAEAATAARLVDAAANHGFIYVQCLGDDNRDIVRAAEIERAFDASRVLFDSPLEEKMRCKIQRTNFGWGGVGSETLDPATQRTADFKEAFNFDDFPDNKPRQPLPSTLLPHHEATIASFRRACHALCVKILYLLGLGLELDPPDFFSSAHSPKKGPSGTVLRFLRYPPLADALGASETDVRAGAHSDYGSLTLLFRLKGQPGLQILTRPPDSAWVPVPVYPPGTDPETSAPPILVNIGDLLSYWTDGLLRSTVHRVVFPSGSDVGVGVGDGNGDGNVSAAETDLSPRYSIAFFCHPVHDTPLTPVPSARALLRRPSGAGDDAQTVGDEDGRNPNVKGRVMTAREHLTMRLAATYGSLYADDDKTAGETTAV